MAKKGNCKVDSTKNDDGEVFDVESGLRIKQSGPLEEQYSKKAAYINEGIGVVEPNEDQKLAPQEQSIFVKLSAVVTVWWSFAALLVDFVLDGMLYTALRQNGCTAFPSPMLSSHGGYDSTMFTIYFVMYLTIAKMPLDALAFLERAWSLRKAMKEGGGILEVAFRQSLREKSKLETRRCPNALNVLFFCMLLMSMLDFVKALMILLGAGAITLTPLAIASAGFGMITADINITWVLPLARFVSNPKIRIAIHACALTIASFSIGFLLIKNTYERYQNTLTFYHVRPILDVVVCVNSEGGPFSKSPLPLTIAESFDVPLIRGTANHIPDWFSNPSAIVAQRVCGTSNVIIPAQMYEAQPCLSYPCSYSHASDDFYLTRWNVVEEGSSLPWGEAGNYNNFTINLANASIGVLTVNGLNCPTYKSPLPLSPAKPIEVPLTRGTAKKIPDWFSNPSSIVAQMACGNSSVIIPAQMYEAQPCLSYPCSYSQESNGNYLSGWDVVEEGRFLPWGVTGNYKNITVTLTNATDGVLTVYGLNCPRWATYTKESRTFDPTVPSSLTAEGLGAYWVIGSLARSLGLQPEISELCGTNHSNVPLVGLNNAVNTIPSTEIGGFDLYKWQSHAIDCGPPWPCFMYFKNVANASRSEKTPLMVSAGPDDPGTLDVSNNADKVNHVVRYVEWRMEILEAVKCG